MTPLAATTLERAADGVPDVPHAARVIITIDGPAGTGKSSIARRLAAALSLHFLDTGAMYRAAAALALREHIPDTDEQRLADLVRRADIRFDWSEDPPSVLGFGEPLSHRLRDPDVGERVSPLSAVPAVRRVLVERQRAIARAHPRLVSEGRDQGSVVFPDAAVKFYLDADAAERARRRVDQIERETGRALDPEERDAVLRDIVARDRRDSTRADGPLVCPDDAVVIDTTHLTFDQVLDRLVREVRERVVGL